MDTYSIVALWMTGCTALIVMLWVAAWTIELPAIAQWLDCMLELWD